MKIELIEKKYNFKFPKCYHLLTNDELFTLLEPQEIINLAKSNHNQKLIPFAVQYYDLNGANTYYCFVTDNAMILDSDFKLIANDFQEFIFLNLLDFMYRKQDDISIIEFRKMVGKLIKKYSNCLNKEQQEIINRFYQREIFSYAPIENMPKTIWFQGFLTKQELDEIKATANIIVN